MGAGPAGTCLALLLARQGVPVVLVEASEDPARLFRGEALMPHGLAVLGAMGLLPLPDTIPQKTLGGWRFLLDGQELFRLAEPLEAGPGPGCTLISQPALLRHLLALLGKLPQVSLILGRRVERLLWRGDRVCGVQLADGATISANLVVAADGRDSPLRQQARIQLLERDRPFDLLWFGLDGESPSPLEGLFTTLVGSEGLFSAFEGASGSVQIGWVQSPSRRSPGTGPGRAGLNAHLAERLAAQSPPDLARWWLKQADRITGPTRLRVEVGQAEQWWRPGLLLLGDAAHPLSPVRAQGLNLALRDAWVAASALAPVLKGWSASNDTTERALHEALTWIEAQRRPEIRGLQALQAAETQRGQLLLQRPLLRGLLASQAPWLGGFVARRWSHDQRPLRQGLVELPPATPAAAAMMVPCGDARPTAAPESV